MDVRVYFLHFVEQMILINLCFVCLATQSVAFIAMPSFLSFAAFPASYLCFVHGDWLHELLGGWYYVVLPPMLSTVFLVLLALLIAMYVFFVHFVFRFIICILSLEFLN